MYVTANKTNYDESDAQLLIFYHSNKELKIENEHKIKNKRLELLACMLQQIRPNKTKMMLGLLYFVTQIQTKFKNKIEHKHEYK